jgi:hypothetical protein
MAVPPHHVFPLYGATALSFLEELDDASKLTDKQKEAVIASQHEVMNRRLTVGLFLISRGQVVAIPDVEFDLLGKIAVVDIRGFEFYGRENRTGRI